MGVVRDHPHRRGERGAREHAAEVFSGSSPQAWGKAVLPGPRALRRGIIPTGVGKGSARNEFVPVSKDHPHRRGERDTIRDLGGVGLGSSPQAWGKGGGVEAERLGEVAEGSSPQAWGKAVHRALGCTSAGIIPTGVGKGGGPEPRGRGTRIIPTGVGKGSPMSLRSHQSSDHPHRRGERVNGSFPGGYDDGSSPQAWGKGLHLSFWLSRSWIIPTGVGKGRS